MKNLKEATCRAKSKSYQSAKGITLVALVVTIIILLILAGITISSLTSEEGVIKEAKTAKEQTERSGVEEQIELAIIKAEQKYRNPTLDDVIKELKNNKVISDEGQVNRKTGAVTSDLGYVIEGKLDDYIQLSLLEKFEMDVESFKHSEQSADNHDRAIGTDGKPVNLDLWKYFKTDDGEGYSLGKHYISEGEYGYDPKNIVDGKIQGKVPQYIYIAEEEKIYPVTKMDGTFCYSGNNDGWTSLGSLKEIPDIPSTVTILTGTFWGNTDLTSARIPNGVKILRADVFTNCSSLVSVEIPESVETLMVANDGVYFKGCSNLKKIEVDGNNKNYSSKNGILFDKEQSKLIRYPEGKKDISVYKIPSSVTTINYYAFDKCTNLSSINIPTNVTTIGYCAFSGWTESQMINCQASSKQSGWDEKWDCYDWGMPRKAVLNWGVSM